MSKFQRWVTGLNPWLPYLLTTFVFQVIRGAVGDSIIFGLACLLLILDWKRMLPWELPERPNYKKRWVVVGLVLAALILFFAPRASIFDIVLLLAIAPTALTLVYYRDHGPLPADTPALKLSVRIWVLIIVAMALFDLFAYIWANVFKDDKNFPTVSILMEPVLANPIGRTFFLMLWMLAGAYILGMWRRRKNVDSAN